MSIATTIKQSRKLIELGLDVKTADMLWMDVNSTSPHLKMMDDGIVDNRDYLVKYPNITLPAWSLSALLKVMPLGTELNKLRNDAGEIYYEIDCKYDGFEDSDPITAAYEMVVWLLEQELIKKGGGE